MIRNCRAKHNPRGQRQRSNVANKSASQARPTKPQLIALGVLIAETCLFPLVFGMFVFSRPLSNVVKVFGNDPATQPSLWFLREQYEFLLARAVDPSSISLSLRLFGLLVWITISVVMLRLVSGPFLFSLLDYRKILKRRSVSTVKFIFLWLFMSTAIWASMDIQGSSSAPLLGALLLRSPLGYVCLEAFVFVTGAIAFVEGLLALFQLALTSDRKGRSSESSPNRAE